MKRTIILFTAFIFTLHCYSQSNVGLNTNNVVDSSAILEVKSNTKGVLIPRIADVSVISNPAVGLLVYNTTINSFSYHLGGGIWTNFPGETITELTDADKDTKIYAERNNSDDDELVFTSGLQTNSETNIAIMDNEGVNVIAPNAHYQINAINSMGLSKTDSSFFAGNNAGANNTNGEHNTFIGQEAGMNSPLGSNNTFIGAYAGNTNESDNNTFIGFNAGTTNTSGNNNLGIGANALNSSNADSSIVIGTNSANLSIGKNNIIIGNYSANSLISGSNNIIIGNDISIPALTSDTLILGNGLGNRISGNLNTKELAFGGYTFPGSTGNAGDILMLNNDNRLEWTGRYPREVAGLLTDLQPFKRELSSTTKALGGEMHFMNVFCLASARVDSVKTYVTNITPGSTIYLGLYASTDSLISKSSVVATVSESFYSIDLNGRDGVMVTSTNNYYLGIYTDDPAAEFLYITDPYISPITENAGGAVLPDNITGGGTATNDAIWLQAF